ncbi:hypothetical protein HDV05_001157, partial [Chytridiales sp. JEL 0842]
VVIIMCVPFAMVNLDDNIGLQIAAFVVSMTILSQWVLSSFLSGFNVSRVPLIEIGPSTQNIIGTVILNYAFTIFIPSWINLKSRNVNAQQTLWSTVGLATVIYTLVGVFPALAYDIPTGNLSPSLILNGVPRILSKITAYMFPIVMLLPAIPVAFIISANNLTQNKIMTPKVALFFCYILPWILVLPLQTGPHLLKFINWSGLLLVSPTNFVIPFVIYLKCLKFRTEYNKNRVLSLKQKQILKSIHQVSQTIQNFIDGKDPAKPNLRRRYRAVRSLRRPTLYQAKTMDDAEDEEEAEETNFRLSLRSSIRRRNTEAGGSSQVDLLDSQSRVNNHGVENEEPNSPNGPQALNPKASQPSLNIDPEFFPTLGQSSLKHKPTGVRFETREPTLDSENQTAVGGEEQDNSSTSGHPTSVIRMEPFEEPEGGDEPWMFEDVPDPEAEYAALHPPRKTDT